MEAYRDFKNRISYQQAELQIRDGAFVPDGRVYGKVSGDNTFKPFFGDTVVFGLSNPDKKKVFALIEKLYEAVPECFCEKLDQSTLHMTLHDLSASENLGDVAADVFENEIKLIETFQANPVQPMKIRMKTNYIINMVDTSLVLALAPADDDENEWNKLASLYELINNVRVCPYPYLTPHITLAYFGTDGFDASVSEGLRAVVRELNKTSFEITLDTNRLRYQKFTNMNKYISVFNPAKIK